jgi:LPXTG-motif cell wall-anchored protein
MVDNLNPTSQFHPYTAPDATPVAEKPLTGLSAMLDRFGLNTGSFGSLQNMNMTKARDIARKNPSLVLGGLAALAIGAGLLRKRR